MSRDELVARMRDHGLRPRAGKFTECQATEAIFGVSDHIGPLAARLVQLALLAGTDPAERNRIIGNEKLWAWEPRASPGPDFGLLDARGRVRAVFEHKRDARSNITSYARFQGRRLFDDPVAQSLVIPEHTPGLHAPGECRGCEGQWHTGLRHGHFAAGMPQIDFYRCTPDRWVRPLRNGGGNVELPDPAHVLWVVLDRSGRTAAEAFPGAHTAAEWHTTSYGDLGPALWHAYEFALTDTETSSQGIEELGSALEAVVYP
jgi:hypothetical protein